MMRSTCLLKGGLLAAILLLGGVSAQAQCIAECFDKLMFLEVDADNNGEISLGDIVRYEITLCHDGPRDTCTLTDNVDAINEFTFHLDLVPNPADPTQYVECRLDDPGQTSCIPQSGGAEPVTPCDRIPGTDTIQGEFRMTRRGCVTMVHWAKVSPLPKCETRICNQATAGGFFSDDPSTPDPADPTCLTALPGIPCIPDFNGNNPSLKDVDPRPSVQEGDPLNYEITVSNSGTGPARNVVVRDTLDQCLDLSGFDPNSNPSQLRIIPGPATIRNWDAASRTLTLGFAVMHPEPAPGFQQLIRLQGIKAGPPTLSCCNQADIISTEIPAPGQSTDDPLLPGPPQEPTCVNIVPAAGPDFSPNSTKLVDPSESVSVGEPITYTIRVENDGEAAANNVVVTDVLPVCIDDADFDETQVSIDPGPARLIAYDRPTRTLRVEFDQIPRRLQIGSVQTITLTGLSVAAAVEQCCNQAVISSDEIPAGQETDDPTQPGLSDPTCIMTEEMPDFTDSIKSVDPAEGVSEGDPLTYTIHVQNTGSGPARDVVVTDVLPECLDLTFFDAAQVQVAPGPASSIDFDPATRTLVVTFDVIEAGELQSLLLRNILAGAASPSCCNQAVITSEEIPPPGQTTDDPNTPVRDRTCITIGAVPNFADSVKTSLNGTNPLEGDPVAYQIDIVNSGEAPSSNVVVTDVLADCLDDSEFDPASNPTQVLVTPGPTRSVSYDRPSRTIRVEFDSIPAAPLVGSLQTILINGLRAGTAGSCCNQALILSDQIPAPGQGTGDPVTGSEQPTCIGIEAPAPELYLLRNDEVTSFQPLTPARNLIFTGNTCPNPRSTSTTLDPEGPDCLPTLGEGVLEGEPGSEFEDDLYRAAPNEVDLTVLSDRRRPLVFWQIEDLTGGPQGVLKVFKDASEPSGIGMTYP